MSTDISIRQRLSLVGLTAAAFIFNTSEFIPIGLLSDIATDFHTSEAHAGMLISAYAWVVMLLSLPLMLAASKMALRRLLLYTIVVFTIFQFLSAVSTGYYMLMAARIGVACSHAIFWSIASPIAVHVVSERYRATALGMIVTGTSIAMIFGLPLGRIVGLYIGWRMTFLCIGLFSLATLLYLVPMLPPITAGGRFSVSQLPILLKNKSVTRLYFVALLVATAYYTAYSFIEPFLKQVAAMPDDWITFTLMLFGGAGMLGSFIFTKLYSRNPHRFVLSTTIIVAICLLLLFPASRHIAIVMGLCVLWGACVTAFNVALQAEIIEKSPGNATAVSMSIFSGIFNLGIACGTMAGGAVCTWSSMAYIGVVGGVIATIAAIYWHKSRHAQLHI